MISRWATKVEEEHHIVCTLNGNLEANAVEKVLLSCQPKVVPTDKHKASLTQARRPYFLMKTIELPQDAEFGLTLPLVAILIILLGVVQVDFLAKGIIGSNLAVGGLHERSLKDIAVIDRDGFLAVGKSGGHVFGVADLALGHFILLLYRHGDCGAEGNAEKERKKRVLKNFMLAVLVLLVLRLKEAG
ncbi:hypothetical protein GJ744_001318 [Endocarpon pusillum]|uniref:Uncharacterized protein n=1 Tax=Endocarpon pusillum TaxID=364733 RepID=A0A8H7E8Q8_9EURO|nr:hypothetical protein GJ744_001318 [Endocarpon pusillum]